MSRRDPTLAATAALLVAACCLPGAPAAPSGTPTHLAVRVPASLLAAHASELPLNLFIRRVPGTLANRGFLLATICDAHDDVAVAWTEPLSASTGIDAWVERGYANNPGTPCGIVAESARYDMIGGPPDRHPRATARVTPGGSASLVVADVGAP